VKGGRKKKEKKKKKEKPMPGIQPGPLALA